VLVGGVWSPGTAQYLRGNEACANRVRPSSNRKRPRKGESCAVSVGLTSRICDGSSQSTQTLRRMSRFGASPRLAQVSQ
jgi:hypothetical protein